MPGISETLGSIPNTRALEVGFASTEISPVHTYKSHPHTCADAPTYTIYTCIYAHIYKHTYVYTCTHTLTPANHWGTFFHYYLLEKAQHSEVISQASVALLWPLWSLQAESLHHTESSQYQLWAGWFICTCALHTLLFSPSHLAIAQCTKQTGEMIKRDPVGSAAPWVQGTLLTTSALYNS